MGVFGVFFGCRGDGGFNGRCLGASIGDGGFMLAYISGCRGVIGFNLATWLCPVREKVRPARPGVGASAKKFALHAQNGRKTLFSSALGELFRGGAAGGAALGELFRGRACEGPVLGELFRVHAPEGTVSGESCRRQAAAGSCPPPTRAPAPRERGNPATASCRRKTPTPRRRPTRSG